MVGTVTVMKRRKRLAPSTSAASYNLPSEMLSAVSSTSRA
jgi:hypothetical protein